MGASARSHVHTPFPHIGDGWKNCTEIWCVVRGQLHYVLHKPRGGGYIEVAHVHIFSISGTAGRIALNIGMWVEGHICYACHSSMDGVSLSQCTCARVNPFSISREGLKALC